MTSNTPTTNLIAGIQIMPASASISVATATAILFQIAASFVPIPCIKSVADAAIIVVKSVEGMTSNRELRNDLIGRICTIMQEIATPLEGKAHEDIPTQVVISLERLTKDLHAIQADLRKHLVSPQSSSLKIGTRLHAFLNHDQVAGDLANCTSKLDWAIQKFQMDGILRMNLNAATHHMAVMDSLGGITHHVQKLARTSTNALQNLPSVAIPDPKEVFHGRDEYVEGAIKTMIENVGGVRLAVLGPGGMGKTSVLLAISHDSRIIAHFGNDNIHWVPCEQAASVELLIGLIAKSLNIQTLSNDPLQDIKAMLRSTDHIHLLLFDNFETPFHIEHTQAEVEEILRMVASSPKVSILVTMRGQARPCPSLKWTQPILPPLPPLTLEPACDTFTDISPETTVDNSIQELVNLVDRVPLAVVIMASLAQLGETPQKLVERYRKEGIALLHQGDDRLHSINVSVHLSIASPPMKMNPEALTLLQILSMLPGGARTTRLSDIAPALNSPDAALATLKRTSLVYVTPNDIVRVLSPISSYVIHNHPLNDPHLRHLYDSYYRLAERSNCLGTPALVQMKLEMAGEEANMDAVVLHALKDDHSREAVKASENYTWFLQAHIPRITVILQAIETAEKQGYLDLLADCLFVKATIDYYRSNMEQAAIGFERSLQIYVSQQSQQQEARCLHRLGDVRRLQDRFDEARSYLVEAKSKFEDISDTLGTAQCLQILSEIHRMEKRHDEARLLLGEARRKFEEIGNTQGIALCLQRLGDILLLEESYPEARSHMEAAKSKFEEISNTIGIAHCLRSLGMILLMEDRFQEARLHLEKAKSKYEEISNGLGIAQCLRSLGEVFRMEGSYGEAEVLFQQALLGYEQVGRKIMVASCRKWVQWCKEAQDT